MAKFRLLDALIAQGGLKVKDLADLPAIVIDNVAKYFYEGTDQEYWEDAKDFPNLAPPFPEMWFEYSRPLTTVSEETGVTRDSEGALLRFGFLVISTDLTLERLEAMSSEGYGKMIDAYTRAGHGDPRLGHFLKHCAKQPGGMDALTSMSKDYLKTKKVRWVTNVVGFMADNGVVQGGGNPLITLWYPIEEDGRFSTVCGNIQGGVPEAYYKWVMEKAPDRAGFINTVEGSTAFVKAFHAAYQVAMLAISFMHCKNVEVRSQADRVSTKKNRHRVPRSGVRYHVLEIEPMQKVIRGAQASQKGESAFRQALHICRGHFKTYGRPVLDTDGKQVLDFDGQPLTTPGLFGREHLKGTYWWPTHIRGSKEAGEVKKDYEVNEPA
jgi:hypothetical protein